MRRIRSDLSFTRLGSWLLKLALSITAIAIAFILARQHISMLRADDILAALSSFGTPQILFAGFAVPISYGAISTFDRLALAYANIDLSWRRSAASSTVSYAISNMLGFPAITANLVRLAYFRQWGLKLTHVATAAICTTLVTNIVLVVLIGAIAFVWSAPLALTLQMDAGILSASGLILSSGAAFLIVCESYRTRVITFGTFCLHPRSGWKTWMHCCGAMVDYLATALVLYILVADWLAVSFLPFLALFAGASLLAIASNVPSGLGVLEGALLSLALPGHENHLIAAILLFRLLYYVLPFVIAAVLVGHQWRFQLLQNGDHVSKKIHDT